MQHFQKKLAVMTVKFVLVRLQYSIGDEYKNHVAGH
uniref:Uncharacterized protein n=1 Tax=Arundo donax TaxID=35708 RepID=A0A0A8Z722_ARUDO